MEKWKEFQELYITWNDKKTKLQFGILQSIENLEYIYSVTTDDMTDCWVELEIFLLNNVLGKISYIKESMPNDGIFQFEMEDIEVKRDEIWIKGYIMEEVEDVDEIPINFLINHHFTIKEFVELLEK